jgi:transposase
MGGEMSSQAVVVSAAAAGRKRKKHSAAERLRIVEETLVPGVSVAAVARAHGINANQIFAWRKLHLAGKLAGRKPATVKPGELSMRLLPVSVSDAPLIAAAPTALLVAPSDTEASTPPPAISSIRIQFAKAKVHVEGAADPALLRAVLECLRG